MLAITRRAGESFSFQLAHLGVGAPQDVTILREELDQEYHMQGVTTAQ